MVLARGVVFDMDGTLIESTICVVGAYQAVAAAAGVLVPSEAAVVAAYPLGPPRVILTHLLGREATTDDEVTYLDALRDRCHSLRVYEGIAETLTQLSGRRRLAVFTGANAAAAQLLLAEVGLLSIFDAVVGGDEVARPKPHPKGILLALQRLGLTPGAAAYVGDSPVDMGAARAARTTSISAAWGHLYDPTCESDYVAKSPEDLLTLMRE
jgi:HAD superfamily hydrolase (TIGR01509 family)